MDRLIAMASLGELGISVHDGEKLTKRVLYEMMPDLTKNLLIF
jgi:hypothetical protein